VAGDSSRKRELLEKLSHALFVSGAIGIELAVSSLSVDVGDNARAAVSRTGNVDQVQVMILDHAVKMNIDEVQSRSRTGGNFKIFCRRV
jgi:hypothetical protein